MLALLEGMTNKSAAEMEFMNLGVHRVEITGTEGYETSENIADYLWNSTSFLLRNRPILEVSEMVPSVN